MTEIDNNSDRLLWIDLETTGLDPQNDRILEVAWAFGDEPIQSAVTLAVKDPYLCMSREVWKMHTQSGLLDCEPDWSAYDALQSRIADSKPKSLVLAGFSVHFDLEFLKNSYYWPCYALSHRVFDVSTLRRLADGLGIKYPPGRKIHRAREDLEDARETYRIIRDALAR